MPNETLSSIEHKLRLLPAVDQPRRCNKMTGYRGPIIFPLLCERVFGVLVMSSEQNEAYPASRVFSQLVGNSNVSPRRTSAKFPRETRGKGLAFCQRNNFSSYIRAIRTWYLLLFMSFPRPEQSSLFYYFN